MADFPRKVRRSISIQRLVWLVVGPRYKNDDFDWRYYTQLYRLQQAHSEERFTLSLQEGDYRFEDGKLVRQRDIKPLHPVVQVTYEALLRLSPASVIEVGCGGGDHLHNLRLLRPSIELFGCDISKEQLDFARERHPELDVPMKVRDITLPRDKLDLPHADIVFTITVIMHIQTGDNHKTALSNLFAHANRQVILAENWSRHAFLDDIQSLFKAGMLPWEAVHFHYHVFEGTDEPHTMIISKEPLAQFPELPDYAILR